MTSEEQDRVLGPCDRRRVILATNVAETSITIEGVTAVVDTGYARQMLFDADSGLDRLELVPISQASADQRAGRAGRTAPGSCLRLWDEASHRRRPAWDAAELQRVDLSSAVLRLMAWGE
ncbi:MAG: helicase-related protein, partial [Planctomycetaceae bacterium]